MATKQIVIMVLSVLLADKVFGEEQALQLNSSPDLHFSSDAIRITFNVTNTSNNEVTVVQVRGNASAIYSFAVFDKDHNVMVQREDTHTIHYSFQNSTLQPGHQLQETLDLSTMYDFSKPGKYFLQAERTTPEELGGATLDSKEISFYIDH